MVLKERPTTLLASTGLKQEEIEALLPVFSAAYAAAHPKHLTWDGKERKPPTASSLTERAVGATSGGGGSGAIATR